VLVIVQQILIVGISQIFTFLRPTLNEDNSTLNVSQTKKHNRIFRYILF